MTERKRRLSLTKADRATGAGVELLALLQDIAADGVLTADEVGQLREWTAQSVDLELPARDYLASIIVDVERDGQITDDELAAVHEAVLRVLPPELRGLAVARRREHRRSLVAQQQEARAAERDARQQQRERDRTLARVDFLIAGALKTEERREACDLLSEGERVWFVREPDNEYDANAIVINTDDEEALGYVPRDIAADLAPLLDAGAKQDARVKKLIETSRGGIIPVVIGNLFAADSSLGHPAPSPSTDIRSPRSAAPFPESAEAATTQAPARSAPVASVPPGRDVPLPAWPFLILFGVMLAFFTFILLRSL
jgi:hypothetical protein